MRLPHLFHGVLALSQNSIAAPPRPAYHGNSTHDKLGAVASETAICSQIGISLIKAGGNAADAMVGTTFCVGVTGMYHSGIGGGGFMTVRSAKGEYEAIDFRETAPAAAFEDMFTNNTVASIYGGLASGVPGEVRGLHYLHKKYGKLSWAEVMKPAIEVARDGFPIGPDLANAISSSTSGGKWNFLLYDPAWAQDFAPNGTLLKLNDTITRKRYANTLETIALQGPDAFYTGPMAEATIRAIQNTGGNMTLNDLRNYTVEVRKPLNIKYRGYKLTTTPPPSSGVVALSVMKILEGYPDAGNAASLNITTHRLDESMRWAYAARTQLGDPHFVAGMDGYAKDMISANTSASIRAKISDRMTHDVAYYNPKGLESLDTPGTSHVVTADASGMAISLTTTINLYFGSQVIVPETGIILNNEMNDFSIPGSSNAFGYIPSVSNYIRPGKRPLSSISPTIVENEDGSLYFVTGSAGGSRIITATIQSLWNVLDRGMTPLQALAEPRLHDQLSPDQVTFEYTYDNSTVSFMKSIGHNVTWMAPGSSTAQCLRLLKNGTFEAAGEPRQKSSGGYAI